MTDTQTSQRLSGPRWLLGGMWRRRLLRARLVWALAPLEVAVLAVLVLVFVAGPWAALAALLAAVGALVSPPGRAWCAPRWWRLRWFWDARAGGLSVDAEPSVFGGSDGPLDRRVLVVPRVRITVHPNGSRSYRCRPLAGQVLADFEAAVPRLSARWGAAAVLVEHYAGDRYVTIHVHRAAPPVATYERAA